MENIIIDLKLKIQDLEKENQALKSKMSLMYSNWHFDFTRFTLLKEKCRRGSVDSGSDAKIDDENAVLRCHSPEQLPVP